MLRRIIRYIRKSRFSYEPLIEVRISKSALLHNLKELTKIAPEKGVAPMLKSNAYGHGLIPVAKILDDTSIPFLVVDSYVEALKLRNEDVSSPILIIGYSHIKNILANKLKRLAFTITSIVELEELSAVPPPPFHLKIDTGITIGILFRELTEAIALIQSNRILSRRYLFAFRQCIERRSASHRKTNCPLEQSGRHCANGISQSFFLAHFGNQRALPQPENRCQRISIRYRTVWYRAPYQAWPDARAYTGPVDAFSTG